MCFGLQYLFPRCVKRLKRIPVPDKVFLQLIKSGVHSHLSRLDRLRSAFDQIYAILNVVHTTVKGYSPVIEGVEMTLRLIPHVCTPIYI